MSTRYGNELWLMLCMSTYPLFPSSKMGRQLRQQISKGENLIKFVRSCTWAIPHLCELRLVIQCTHYQNPPPIPSLTALYRAFNPNNKQLVRTCLYIYIRQAKLKH